MNKRIYGGYTVASLGKMPDAELLSFADSLARKAAGDRRAAASLQRLAAKAEESARVIMQEATRRGLA